MSKKIKYVGIGLAAMLLIASAFVVVNQVKADPITFFIDNMSNLTGSTSGTPQTSGHDFVFITVTGVTTGQHIAFTLPVNIGSPFEGFQHVGDVKAADIILTDNGGSPISLEDGACTGPADANWAVTASSGSGVVSLTACDSAPTIDAGHTVEVVLSAVSHAIENPNGSVSPYTINLTAGGDSGSFPDPVTGPQDVSVTGSVVQSLSFTLSKTAVTFNQLSPIATKTNSHTMTMSTNAASGMQIVVNDLPLYGTLRSGPGPTYNWIPACGDQTFPPFTGIGYKCSSVTGTAQFGINLVGPNTTPSVGAAIGCATAPCGIAGPAPEPNNYDVINKFSFKTGNVVASSSAPINPTVYTVSYIANISSTTPAGAYTDTLTYTATVFF